MPPPPPNDQEIDAAIRALPAAPRILAQLAPRLQSLDAEIGEVTTIVKRDSGLTGALIHAANSAAYFGYEASTTVEDAIARIGFGETHRIIGQVAARQLTDEPLPIYGLAPRRMRENSLFCALMMEQLTGGRRLDAGTGYTLGLLRSMGKIILDRLGRRDVRTIRLEASGRHLLDWERGNWAITNPEVAARAFALWDFPAVAIDAVRDHIVPISNSPREAYLLHLAAAMAEARGFGTPGETAYWRPVAATCPLAGIDEARLNAVADQAHEIVQRISVAFS